MNAIAPVVARLRDPGELVAAVPYLLGFHPRDSLVVITLDPGDPPTVGLVMRADLPAADVEHELIQQICAPIRVRNPPAVILVVIGEAIDPPPPVLSRLRESLTELGVEVAPILWAASTEVGADWAFLEQPQHRGRLPDPAASPMAAAATAAGLVTFADREQLHRLVAADDDEALQRRAWLLDDAVVAADRDRSATDRSAVTRDLELVRAAVQAARLGRLPADDSEIVRLAVALSDPLVRDCCVSLCTGETAAAAERLWLALTRATPPPEVAEPAALAAISAYLRGDGALASMAVDRTLEAWPGHTLGSLLHAVLLAAVPPEQLGQLLADAARDAELQLSEDGADR